VRLERGQVGCMCVYVKEERAFKLQLRKTHSEGDNDDSHLWSANCGSSTLHMLVCVTFSQYWGLDQGLMHACKCSDTSVTIQFFFF
jgi:hypothetical protein